MNETEMADTAEKLKVMRKALGTPATVVAARAVQRCGSVELHSRGENW